MILFNDISNRWAAKNLLLLSAGKDQLHPYDDGSPRCMCHLCRYDHVDRQIGLAFGYNRNIFDTDDLIGFVTPTLSLALVDNEFWCLGV